MIDDREDELNRYPEDGRGNGLPFEQVQRQTEVKKGRGPIGFLMLVAVLAALGVALAWSLLEPKQVADGPVPTVKPEAGKIKERPEQPGGLEVPNEDKLVYDRLGEDKEAKTETLTPAAETPAPPPAEPPVDPRVAEAENALEAAKKAAEEARLMAEQARQAVEAEKAAAAENAAAAPAPEPAPVEEVVPVPPPPAVPEDSAPAENAPEPAPVVENLAEEKTAEAVEAPSPDPVFEDEIASPPPPRQALDSAAEPAPAEAEAAAAPEAAPEAAPAAAPAAPATQTAAVDPKGSYLIQLAAVSSKAQAETQWKRLQDRYPDLLGVLQPVITEVTLAQGKTLYRLRAGGFATGDAARNRCTALKERKVECFIVAPGG